MPPHRVGFLRRLGLKTGIHFCSFWSGIGYGFRGNYGKIWTYLSFQFRMSKKEREICELEMDSIDFFCLRSNVSNDDIISTWRPGLKSGMGFSGLVWKRKRKSTFFGLKSGQDLENRAVHPYQDIPRSTPPPPGLIQWRSRQDSKTSPKRRYFS